MVGQNTQPLVSVVILARGSLLPNNRCLSSVLGQTFVDKELIFVNLGAEKRNTEIVTKLQQEHGNIRSVNLAFNVSASIAQLEGFRIATGKYVVLLDAHDDISADYVRIMFESAEKNSSDIVIPETVINKDKKKYILNLANDLRLDNLHGDKCLKSFFEQRGENDSWYRLPGVLYSKKIIDSALPYVYKTADSVSHFGDTLPSVIFWSFARHISRAQTAYYFRSEDSNSPGVSIKNLKNELLSVEGTFAAVIRFLKEKDLYKTFEKDLLSWMNQSSFEYHALIDGLQKEDRTKKELAELIKFGDEYWAEKSQSQFYRVATPFSTGLEDLKHKIIDNGIQYVSFDIFDTLVTRPFLQPSDIFHLLDDEFKVLDGKFRLESFHNIRIKSEELARCEENDGEDVSLSQIYAVMEREYRVENAVAQKILKKELGYEIRFCRQRETAKELYDLSRYLGKKIIITSDMYLPKKTVEAILSECGYDGYVKLYVSSHHGTMKATQNLYRHIATELGVLPESIIHIGDNYESDVVAAKAAGWEGYYFPKATAVSPDIFHRIFGKSGYYAQSHLGVSSAYAIAMNKYFDNPFRSFLGESNYNSSPYFMGYFALGLSLLGFTKWMIDDVQEKKIDSVIFLSRDGYLPKQIFDMFQQRLHLPIDSHYLPTSRKAIIPLSLFNEANIAELKTFNYRGQISESILRSLKDVQKSSTDVTIENIDFKKVKRLQKAFVSTYKNYLGERTAIMDIGYSGRPEQIFAELFRTPFETYFMYAGSDEAERRLGKTVNIYNRPKVASLREKMISELGPSCVSYRLCNETVEPIFNDEQNSSYYEKYVLSEVQAGARDFVGCYLDFFYEHLNVMTMGDNRLVAQPLDQATAHPSGLDSELFRGLMHNDDIAGEKTMDLFDVYYSSETETAELRAENEDMRMELWSRMGIKRSAILFAGNIKRRIMYGKNR